MEQNNFTKEQKEYLKSLFNDFTSLDLKSDFDIGEFLEKRLCTNLNNEDTLYKNTLLLVLVKWSCGLFYDELSWCSSTTCAGCIGCEELDLWDCDYLDIYVDCSILSTCPVGKDVCKWLCDIDIDSDTICIFLRLMLEKLGSLTEKNLTWLIDTAEMYAEDWKDSEEEEDYDR